jgi:hypothetical protein
VAHPLSHNWEICVDLRPLVRIGRAHPPGVAELWWESVEDVLAAVSTPAGQQAAIELLAYERRFIDLEHSPLWIGEEFEVIAST